MGDAEGTSMGTHALVAVTEREHFVINVDSEEMLNTIFLYEATSLEPKNKQLSSVVEEG